MSNPFLDEGSELLALDTQRVFDELVVNTVSTIEDLEKVQCDSYNKNIINERTKSFHEPIKRNSLPLLR